MAEIRKNGVAGSAIMAVIWFIVALFVVAMIVGTISSARATGTGMPMMEGLKNPTELATLVEKSLAIDPSGKKQLDPARCKQNGSCATAYDYFYGIGLAHQSAKLENIAELPRYLRSLKSQPHPAGKWHLSRLLVRGEQHTYDAKGWTRAFSSGEIVWNDVNTGEHILAGDCGNVIGEPVNVPSTAKVTQFAKYALQINCMSDRENGFWLDKYETAKAKRADNLTRGNINQKGMVPYYEVFTLAPFGEMLTERKSRPLDCKFFVRFVKKEPVLNIQSGDSVEERAAKYNEYLKQFQYPQDDNVISDQWASTGNRGWVIIPVTLSLDQFEAVLIQPENMGDVLEPLIAVHRPEFATQSNPIHIWEVKRPQ